MNLFLFILVIVNNPKVNALLDFLNLEKTDCDILKVEYEIGSVKIFMYDLNKSTAPKVKDLSLQDYCNIIGFVSDIELSVSQVTLDTIFDLQQHRKILSSVLALPSGYLQFQYEDETENTDVSMYMEYKLRNTFKVV